MINFCENDISSYSTEVTLNPMKRSSNNTIGPCPKQDLNSSNHKKAHKESVKNETMFRIERPCIDDDTSLSFNDTMENDRDELLPVKSRLILDHSTHSQIEETERDLLDCSNHEGLFSKELTNASRFSSDTLTRDEEDLLTSSAKELMRANCVVLHNNGVELYEAARKRCGSRFEGTLSGNEDDFIMAGDIFLEAWRIHCESFFQCDVHSRRQLYSFCPTPLPSSMEESVNAHADYSSPNDSKSFSAPNPVGVAPKSPFASHTKQVPEEVLSRVTAISSSTRIVDSSDYDLSEQVTLTMDDHAADAPPTTSYIYQRMDFDEGMHAFSNVECLELSDQYLKEPTIEDLYSEESTEVENGNVNAHLAVAATILFNIGQVHRRMEMYDAASKYYDFAYQALLHSSPTWRRKQESQFDSESPVAKSITPMPVHPIAVSILQNTGQLQYRRGDLPLAIGTYTLALRTSLHLYKTENNLSVASALNSLGVLHYHMSSTQSTRAMGYFKRALNIRKLLLHDYHEDVATVLNNIGRIHVQRDAFHEALSYYEEALKIRHDRLGSNSLDYAATAFNAGQSLHQLGNLDEALKLYQEFLNVAEEKFSRNHRDIAVVLSGIANIYQDRGEHKKALELYTESLGVGRAALGEYHSEIAMLLNRIGNFHFERENLDEALASYKDGLRIERRLLEPDHPNIVVTLSNLGEIYRQKGDWNSSLKLYKEVLELQKKKYKTDHADIASTLNTIGLVYDQKGETSLSLRFLQDALLMRRNVLGSDHIDLSATLTYLGTILYRKNMLGLAMELFSESLIIRKKNLGNDHRDVAFTLYNIALVHQQCGSHVEAIECFLETLRVEKLILGEMHRDVSMTLYKLGETYKANNDFDQALNCFEAALGIERQTIGREDPATVARTLNEIGNIHLATGNVTLMMASFNEAARIYSQVGLNPNNLIVSDQLYAFDVSCPEAAPAA